MTAKDGKRLKELHECRDSLIEDGLLAAVTFLWPPVVNSEREKELPPHSATFGHQAHEREKELPLHSATFGHQAHEREK